MSKYLWGIAQLVNDPSNELIDVLQKRISKISPGHVTNKTDERLDKSEKGCELYERKRERDINSSPNCLNEPTCSIKNLEVVNSKSKSTQIGRLPNKCRHAVVQTSNHKHLYVSKTTSIPYKPRLNQSTQCNRITKTDASTDPIIMKTCKEHKDVFAILKEWSNVTLKGPDTDLYTLAKKKIMDLINLIKIEKIQCFPEYHGEEQIIRLYRRASCGKFNRKHTKRRKSEKF